MISFYLKDGPDDGDKGCKASMEEFRRKEAARIARRENETRAKAGVRISHHVMGMGKVCIVPTVIRKDDGAWSEVCKR